MRGSTPSTATSPCSAVGKLDAERKAQFDRLWSEARAGDEQRLCAQAADTQQGVTPECIDWAAFTAIAGDHSCSSSSMLDSTLKSDWILQVADVAAQLKVDLSQIVVAARPDVRLVRPERPRRLPAPGRRRDAARAPHQRAAHLRHAPATRRPAIRDPRRLQQRPLPAAPAEHRHDAARVRRALAQARVGHQRRRRLRLVPPERAAEGLAAGQRVARAGRAPRAGARDAGRRGIRAPLPRGHLRGRPRRGHMGRRVAAQGHARPLQRVRPRGLHLGRRQRVGGPDGRRAHARRGHRARRGWPSATASSR